MDTGAMDWVKSPVDGVWRKRLELKGPLEAGRVTSLVRFDAGAKFPAHDHPGGEEILVLSGVFSDHTGDYGPGSYMVNTEGFSHEPWSDDGCELFVKLQQYGGPELPGISFHIDDKVWAPGPIEGFSTKLLSGGKDEGALTRLGLMAAGARLPLNHPGLIEEIFLLEGSFTDDNIEAKAGTWLRYPAQSHHELFSAEGARFYMKLRPEGEPQLQA